MNKVPILRLCPQCSSTNVITELGGMTGALYHCLDCDYLGPVIIEHELTEDEIRAFEEERMAEERTSVVEETPRKKRLFRRSRP